MKTDFLLYLDILGFGELSARCDPKVEAVYDCLLKAKKAANRTYKIVIFSDTVLVQNVGLEVPTVSLTFLCEFFTDLQYRLSKLQIFIRGVIKNGLFTMERRDDVEIFHGPAIIAAYNAEKEIKAVGLFVCKECSQFNHHFTLTAHDKYYFVQTLLSVVRHAQVPFGQIEVDRFTLEETDQLCYLRDDIDFLRQISTFRHADVKRDIKDKHETTWQLIRACNASLLDALEESDFDLEIVNKDCDWSLMGMYA
jgi:hypothetical protein